jgi:20S proteasome alpha/beta subunit
MFKKPLSFYLTMDTIKQHQEMGYDRSVGMFSPDGLLLQVEYAEKAVKLGTSVLAITTKDGITFVGDRKIKSKLLIKDSFKKVFEVDSHIAIAGAGVMSDGRRLIEHSQH